MHFSYSCIWDKGDFYEYNQDSYALQVVMTGSGPYAMVMVCDGVGSLVKGEYASGLTVTFMTEWFYEQALPMLCCKVSAKQLHRSLKRALCEVHNRLKYEGEITGTAIGTTFSMLILAPYKYYYFYVGDCVCYKIGKRVKKVGNNIHGKKGELLHAVGVGDMADIREESGFYSRKNMFLLCSDGFYRCLTLQAIFALAQPGRRNRDKRKLLQEIVIRGRSKGEKDNCTGIIIGRN